MKKKVLKSTKSFIAAIALCAVLALGAFGTVLSADLGKSLITVSAWPGFLEGLY